MRAYLISVMWAFLGFSFIGPSPATASDPVIAIYDFFPFGRLEESGRVTGIFADLARVVEEKSGIELQLRLEPIPRAIRNVVMGHVDLIISGSSSKAMVDTPAVGILGCHRTVVLTRKNSGISDLASLRDKRVAYVTGGIFKKKFAGSYGEKIEEVGSSQSLFHMLFRDRIDAFFISDVVLAAYVKFGVPVADLPEDWRTVLGPTITAETLHVTLRMSKESSFKALIPRLRRALDQCNRDGTFEAVYHAYGLQSGGRCEAK